MSQPSAPPLKKADQLKEIMAQKLAQEIVNRIVADDVIDDKINEELEKQKEPGCCSVMCAPFTLKYYQPYFDDLTTKIVLTKLFAAFFPFRATFFEIQGGKADLYGPFWIYATLVFTLAAAGNFSTYLSTPSGYGFTYNFTYIPDATSLLFGIAVIVPLVIYFTMKMLGSKDVKLSSIICVYAYAQTCIIPVCVVCAIPNPQLQWAAIIYAAVNSSLFLIVNYWQELESNLAAKKHIIIFMIAGAQVFLLLLFKLYFFMYVFKSPFTKSSELQIDYTYLNVHIHHNI